MKIIIIIIIIMKKKILGKNRFWATAQLYCEKKKRENCIAILKFYCKQ